MGVIWGMFLKRFVPLIFVNITTFTLHHNNVRDFKWKHQMNIPVKNTLQCSLITPLTKNPFLAISKLTPQKLGPGPFLYSNVFKAHVSWLQQTVCQQEKTTAPDRSL